MSGLNFSLGGKLDPSFKASFDKAESEARAAGMRIQNSLKTQITGIDKRLSKMEPTYSEYGPLMEKRANLSRSLLISQNNQYVAAARQRMAILDEEKQAERERYDASTAQSGGGNPRANIEAENALMLKNRDALKALIEERKRAADEQARYNSSSSQSGVTNPRAGLDAENAAMLRNSAALKTLIAERAKAKAELERYNASISQSGGFANPRASMASDAASWAAKLAEFRAMKGSSGLTAAGESEKFAGNIANATGHVAGLNLILRETLVVFREISRGNWSRVPSSVSMIVQGFAQMKEISLLTLGIWAGSIGAIVGSFFIYLHRIKKEAQELATSVIYAFKPEHLAAYESKLEVLNQLHKDVAESARSIQEAHDSVGNSIQRQLDLTKDRISFERELLEAQKTNALAAAKNPAEREAIEKKFSKLILAKKKEERDAELAAMKQEAKELPSELMATRYQIAKLTNGGAFMSEGQDAQILKNRQAASDAADKYFEQLPDGEKDARAHSADADRKIINDFQNKKKFWEDHKDAFEKSGQIPIGLMPTETDQANFSAAQQRLANNAGAQQSLNAWINSKDERNRARERVKELEKRVKDDADRLAKLNGTPGHGGLIADQARKNLLDDQHDLALLNERLKRVDPGRPLSGREVTERERVGFGSPTIALLDVNKRMDMKLSQIVHNTNPRGSGGVGSFSTGVPGGFGD